MRGRRSRKQGEQVGDLGPDEPPHRFELAGRDASTRGRGFANAVGDVAQTGWPRVAPGERPPWIVLQPGGRVRNEEGGRRPDGGLSGVSRQSGRP